MKTMHDETAINVMLFTTQLLSKECVKAALHKSESEIEQLVKDKVLVAVKTPRYILFTKESVLKVLRQK